jgi:hypothetical protein
MGGTGAGCQARYVWTAWTEWIRTGQPVGGTPTGATGTVALPACCLNKNRLKDFEFSPICETET